MPRKKPPHYSSYGKTPDSGPDWRWSRAMQILESRRNRSLERDGPEIYRAVGFLRLMMNGYNSYHSKQLLRKDPQLAMATKLATEGGRTELELQCRVLSGESLEAAAIEVGTTLAVASTYCTFFFDVTSKLQQVSYIRHRVCQIPINGAALVESLMKFCCFNHGPLAVPCWLDYLDNMGGAHDLTTAVGRQRETIELYISTMNLPLDESTESSFLKRAAYITQMGKKMYQERTVGELFTLTTSQMLSDSVRWSSKPDHFAKAEPAFQCKQPPSANDLHKEGGVDKHSAAV